MSKQPPGERFPRGVIIAGLVLWGLAGCQTRPPAAHIPKPAPAPAPATEPVAIPEGARQYAVMPEESWLQVLVYRGGSMARLGHNHVVASHHLAGAVFATNDPTQVRFDIQIPVNELTVDEPSMRELAGADFSAAVPQSARDGTRKNLLSEPLLDAERFPTIALRGTGAAAAGEGFELGVAITIKDQVHEVRVPLTLKREDGVLVATGEFPLKQSELGLKPFAVAMGTLTVLDEMRVRFEVTARDDGQGSPRLP
jgi:polyisoprenoid-binding protein YceI